MTSLPFQIVNAALQYYVAILFCILGKDIDRAVSYIFNAINAFGQYDISGKEIGMVGQHAITAYLKSSVSFVAKTRKPERWESFNVFRLLKCDTQPAL